MDKDTSVRVIVAIALTLAVVVLWGYLFPPPAPAALPAATSPATDSGTPAATPGPADSPAPESSGSTASPLTNELNTVEAVVGSPDQEPVTIRTDVQEITFSARGARVLKWELLTYPRDPSAPDQGVVDLVSPESRQLGRLPLGFDVSDESLAALLNDSWYVVDDDAPTPAELNERGLPPETSRVRFRFADGRGVAATKTIYVAADDSYLSFVEWSLERGGAPVDSASLSWGPGVGRVVKSESTYVRTQESAIVDLPEGKSRFHVDDVPGTLEFSALRTPRWLSLDERYFGVAFIPTEAADSSVVLAPAASREPQDEEEQPRRLAIETSAEAFWLFTGPKYDALLKEVDARLGSRLLETIDWGFFGIVARPLYLIMASIHGVVGNWGTAILLITLAIRLLFVPLTHKSMVSMRRTQEQMAKLQPKIRKVKEKYEGKRDMESRQKMSEEMMALYKREGVNPLSSLTGCLPLFLQLPVLWAMLSVLTVVIELRGAPFYGWIRDLSAPDPTYVTPILMGLTMFGQQVMTMAKTDDPQQRSQQRIMLFMPLMFTYFFLWAPSGLVLYWLANSVLGIAQQWFVNRHAQAAKREAQAA